MTLPRADVFFFFYKRKLTLNNLTAINSQTRICNIRTKAMSGRAGNDMVRAYLHSLEDARRSTTYKCAELLV